MKTKLCNWLWLLFVGALIFGVFKLVVFVIKNEP